MGALVMSWGIYQHRFLNIMPVSRDLLVETMETGVIVTDTENRIIDINRSVSTMFDLGDTTIIGRDISEIPALVGKHLVCR